MRRFAIVIAAFAASSCMMGPTQMRPLSVAEYQSALAVRSAEDLARDAARKPAEVLAFAQVAPGSRVGDYIMGGGYFTRALSAAVGVDGKVYAFQPNEFITYRADYAKEQDETVAKLGTTKGVRGSISDPPFLEPLDTIVTIQNFHDLFLKPFPADTVAKASAALFRALKPGGSLVVIDHAAAPGSGPEAADKLHRIDKALVVGALTAAGFTLEAESALFSSSADPHTASVFDPAIRGKTDQFALRFRKPG